MSVDVQFAFPQQIPFINTVSMIMGAPVPTVEVVGDDFSSVDEVLFNEIPSPNVFVVSPTTLMAQIPPIMIGVPSLEIVVVSYKAVFTERNIIAFRIGRTNRKVSGLGRLVQLFLKVLLTTPGTDIFHSSSGGGAMVNLGKNFSRTEAGNIIGDFVVSVDNATRQIVASQARIPRLSPAERLLSAKVTASQFDAEQTALIVTVQLSTQAGRVAIANLVL
jgi:hypothetical protein